MAATSAICGLRDAARSVAAVVLQACSSTAAAAHLSRLCSSPALRSALAASWSKLAQNRGAILEAARAADGLIDTSAYVWLLGGLHHSLRINLLVFVLRAGVAPPRPILILVVEALLI